MGTHEFFRPEEIKFGLAKHPGIIENMDIIFHAVLFINSITLMHQWILSKLIRWK